MGLESIARPCSRRLRAGGGAPGTLNSRTRQCAMPRSSRSKIVRMATRLVGKTGGPF
jgi:hypothetical protein